MSEVVELFMFVNNIFSRFNNSNVRFGQYNTNQNVSNPSAKDEFRQKTIYGNDFHGHLNAFTRFKTAVDEFRLQNPNGDVILSGDDWVGASEEKNIAIVRLMNLIKPTAVTIGNHNLDNKGSKGLSEMLDYATFKTVALNLKPKNPDNLKAYALQDDINAGRLADSIVVDENGTKVGYIGLLPTDLFARLSAQSQANAKDIKILNLEETKKAVQDEVNKLEKQGIKVIKLVSHMGVDADKEIAKSVSGIDVIHGGHSHDNLDGLVQGKNLFLSPRGEWVILTQAGKNGHKYGELDVVYDKDGKIIKAHNELKSLETLPESLTAKVMTNMMMGEPLQIGVIAQEVKSKPETVLEESPLSSFLSDAYLKYSGADLVLNNMGGIRGSLPAGAVTDRDIIDLMPYYNDVHVYKLSEKDIMDALNGAIQALRKYHRTGALQVAGMKYTIGKDDKVKDVIILRKDGTQEKLNSENPSTDKFFNVAYNTFVAGGSEGLGVLNAPEKMIKKCDLTETEMFIEYIKSFNGKPIVIKEDGRIKQEV